ncbi:ketosynthase chain-length factor [Thermobifida alba]|uniref:Ketosynthase chain-length factor n=1 Tax=Thermobifida alba TaxID=53522 RepID=A0ABY4L0H2_THEAE|nr:ketosynthase chain-length factor [Thermobifida alba]UPT20830.1 ketosynthase chain-length factor [Thermobifida alba]
MTAVPPNTEGGTRPVITGIGVIAPTGIGAKAHWEATLRGENAIVPVDAFGPEGRRSRLLGEVRGFVAEDHIPGRLLPQSDRITRFALAAAEWALVDAGSPQAALSAEDMAVVTANSTGGIAFGQRELEKLWGRGPQYVSAYMSFAWFYAVNTGQLSIRHDMRGPMGVVVTEQAGGLDAIAQARRVLRAGTPLALTGGMDSAVCPYGLAAQAASGRLTGSDDPDRAYLPFDRDATGHVAGEGGAMLVLESADRARSRGVRGYGEISGYCATFDPPPGSGRPTNLRRAIEGALEDAGTAPNGVSVVFADAAGETEADQAEAEALSEVFGPRGVPVTAPKTMTGRLYAGAGPLDLVSACLALRERIAPPTINSATAADAAVDLVTGAPRPLAPGAALVVARGTGGFNSAVIVEAAQPRP